MAGLCLNAAAQGQTPSVISCLEIYDLASGTHTIIREFPFLIEAPNWTPDGQWLVVNKEGRLYKIAPDGKGELIPIDTGNIIQCNNDHVITADGKWIGLSSNDPANKHVQLRMIPSEGGTPVVLLDFFGGQGSLNVNSWNPGSTRFAFVSYRLAQ